MHKLTEDIEDQIFKKKHYAKRILELGAQLNSVEEERNMYAEWILYQRIGIDRWDWLKN